MDFPDPIVLTTAEWRVINFINASINKSCACHVPLYLPNNFNPEPHRKYYQDNL